MQVEESPLWVNSLEHGLEDLQNSQKNLGINKVKVATLFSL